MKQNVGPREQILRVTLGCAAIAAVLFFPKLRRWRWLLGSWGIANLASGATRYCPSNQLTGIDNTSGHELIHFDESLGGMRGHLAHRLNRLQRRMGVAA